MQTFCQPLPPNLLRKFEIFITSASLKASFGETQAKKVLGYWKRRTFLAFCVRTKMKLYDIRSQEHAWLLSLSVEKQTSLTAGYEKKPAASNWLPFFDQSEKSIVTTRGVTHGEDGEMCPPQSLS